MCSRSRRRALLALSLFPVIWGGIAVASLPPARPGRTVLVVAAPFGDDAATLVRKARGYLVDVRRPFIGRLAHAQDTGFVSRLRDGGALLLLDAERLSNFMCGADA